MELGPGLIILAIGFCIVGIARHCALDKDGFLDEDRRERYPSERRPRQ